LRNKPRSSGSRPQGSQTVAEVIREDFAELRKYGIDTPAMKAIKALLTK
jgi:hypothetical protein